MTENAREADEILNSVGSELVLAGSFADDSIALSTVSDLDLALDDSGAGFKPNLVVKTLLEVKSELLRLEPRKVFDETSPFASDSFDADLQKAHARSNKRFEMGVGLSSVKLDALKFQSVSNLSFWVTELHLVLFAKFSLFQFTNQELEKSDNFVQPVYTSKTITKDSNEYNEVFVDQTRKVQNQEVIYEEFTVHMFFACEDLWDPTILQNQKINS